MKMKIMLCALALVVAGTASAQSDPAAEPPTAETAPAETSPAAEPPPEAAAPAPIALETLPLDKAKGKWTESAFATGGYFFASQTQVVDKSGPFSIDVLGSSRSKKQVTVKYRFTKMDTSPLLEGACTINSKMWSGLWNTTENSLYTCTFKDMPPERFAFEAVVPGFTAETGSIISFTSVDPKKYEGMKARLLYDGTLYEAVPTALNPDNELAQQRVALGYKISRDGTDVGRIDFPDMKKVMIVMGSDPDRKSVLTAPVANDNGREAVIFFAAQLLRLPEANSPALKAE
jgi:hypothetical protein